MSQCRCWPLELNNEALSEKDAWCGTHCCGDGLIALLLFQIRSVIYLFSEEILRCRRFSVPSQTLETTVAHNCDGKINLVTTKSIWPRQFQFGHGNFNLAKATSIWSRQNQFRHGNINLHTWLSWRHRSSQCAVRVYPTWRWVNGTVENVLCKLWIYGLARSQLLRAVRKRWVFIRL